jgi:hypothetical protein
MVARKVSKLGDISPMFLRRIKEENLQDVLLTDWWRYTDLKHTLDFYVDPDELGLRSFFCPWNGYYIWSYLMNPMRNNQIMAEMNHNAKVGEGVYQYAMWDLSYDRIHDCFADYGWNFEGAGSVDDVTERYVNRHFAPMAKKIRHAYKLMDLCTESSLGVRDGHFAINIVSVTLKYLVLTHSHRDEKIAVRSAVAACVSVSFTLDGAAVVDTCGNIYVCLHALSDVTRTRAFLAGILDSLAASAACGTGSCLLHHAERSSGLNAHLSRAFTSRAGLG